MIKFDNNSVEVNVEKGNVLAFSSGRNQKAQTIYNIVYNKMVKSPESVEARKQWDGWHNYGARNPGFDLETILKVGDTFDFNRNFIYAPYGGVSISTYPNNDMVYRICSVPDDKSQFDFALATFIEWNNINNKFIERFSGISVFGPYAVYIAK